LAYNALGYCYKEGKGVVKSDSTAIEYYEKAAAQDVIEAMLELGKLYEKKGEKSYRDYRYRDFNEASKWYLKAAENGNKEAQYWMGVLFDKGHHYSSYNAHEPSMKDALKWYRKAAEQGHDKAKQRLQELGD
jgi:hypothetical protein